MSKQKYIQPEISTEESEVLNLKHKQESNGTSPKQRVDCKGVKIIKGGKKHKITFSNQLVQVQVVENWKEFNFLEEEAMDEQLSSWSLCKKKCLIF